MALASLLACLLALLPARASAGRAAAEDLLEAPWLQTAVVGALLSAGHRRTAGVDGFPVQPLDGSAIDRKATATAKAKGVANGKVQPGGAANDGKAKNDAYDAFQGSERVPPLSPSLLTPQLAGAANGRAAAAKGKGGAANGRAAGAKAKKDADKKIREDKFEPLSGSMLTPHIYVAATDRKASAKAKKDAGDKVRGFKLEPPVDPLLTGLLSGAARDGDRNGAAQDREATAKANGGTGDKVRGSKLEPPVDPLLTPHLDGAAPDGEATAKANGEADDKVRGSKLEPPVDPLLTSHPDGADDDRAASAKANGSDSDKVRGAELVQPTDSILTPHLNGVAKDAEDSAEGDDYETVRGSEVEPLVDPLLTAHLNGAADGREANGGDYDKAREPERITAMDYLLVRAELLDIFSDESSADQAVYDKLVSSLRRRKDQEDDFASKFHARLCAARSNGLQRLIIPDEDELAIDRLVVPAEGVSPGVVIVRYPSGVSRSPGWVTAMRQYLMRLEVAKLTEDTFLRYLAQSHTPEEFDEDTGAEVLLMSELQLGTLREAMQMKLSKNYKIGLNYFLQALRLVQRLHDKGIPHVSDITPDTVFVLHSYTIGRVALSPEIISGSSRSSPEELIRSDIRQLGTLLRFLMSGEFDADVQPTVDVYLAFGKAMESGAFSDDRRATLEVYDLVKNTGPGMTDLDLVNVKLRYLRWSVEAEVSAGLSKALAEDSDTR